MAMTIEEAMEHGTGQLDIFGGKHKEFIECALETMRKYQELLDYIGGMNMCDEISNEAYKKIMIKFSE